ncbi:hypothetical protein ARMSODRAFT_980918 [Armillaria solidipes]|uniref:Uncharacterized protein n=1 Tax=Armillaria solidipes TaxID=1076256 RepID=A0A2H3BGF5_9AGAR|nr:hypothetical protein ARMSODRAFT_980918 [Armillaria solidipes]
MLPEIPPDVAFGDLRRRPGPAGQERITLGKDSLLSRLARREILPGQVCLERFHPHGLYHPLAWPEPGLSEIKPVYFSSKFYPEIMSLPSLGLGYYYRAENDKLRHTRMYAIEYGVSISKNDAVDAVIAFVDGDLNCCKRLGRWIRGLIKFQVPSQQQYRFL